MRALRLLLSALLMTIAFQARAETWTVISEETFPPYNFTENGQRTGIDVEIVNAVLERMGVTPEHKGLPWNRVVNDLDQNQTDIAFQFVAKPERFMKYNMVGPHRSGLTVIAVRADSSITFQTLDDLRGLRVGTVQGFSYTPEFDAADFIVKDPAIDNTLSIRKLANHRIDAVIGDLHTLGYLAHKEGVADQIRFLPKAVSEVPRFLAFPKARKAQADRFAAALAELQASGAIDRIIRKWQTPGT